MDFPVMPPANEPTPPTPGPACTACGERALVHWLRRLTDDELADHIRIEADRRAEVVRLADPQLPTPVFPPLLPIGEDFTRTVYSCGPHAITMDAAALVHASSCTAPNEADLPDCDCIPEPPPEAPMEAAAAPLPDHWVTGGS